MIEGRPRRPWDRTPPGERDYFELLGEGLLCYVPAPPGGSGESGWSPPLGGAWVHLGPDGRVRAFTGKVEVGQGTLVALSLLVAEELRVPFEQVDLTVGDTDRSPWDMGTFGSRSMPDAAPALRAAAAVAREELLSLAAKSSGRPRESLEAEGGHLRARDGTWSSPYGELVRGLRKLVEASPSTPLTPAASWSLAGHPRVDPTAEEVVTGRRRYTSDLMLPGMLYGAVLHPPRYGAKLRRIEMGALRDRSRVRGVHEGDFVGVVAPTPWEARSALSLIEAEWEESPQPDEAEIEAYLRAHPSKGDDWDTDRTAQGDPEAAFQRSSARVEATYRSAYLAHVPLETRAAVGTWDGPRATVWVGTQTPFRARDHVAKALGISPDDVRVIVPYTGSGFGGKHGGDVALAALRLSRAAGRPVMIHYSRPEEFQHGYFRGYTLVDVRAGADPRGTLLSWSFHNVNGGAAGLDPPYRIAHQKVDNELSEAPLPQGAYRAIGATVNNFARETAVDELAVALGSDPVEFRRQNLADERLRTVLDRASEISGWKVRRAGEGRGTGVAVGLEKASRIATVAEVGVDGSRRVKVRRLTCVFEAGAVVRPDNLTSQVEGAAVMALGGALFERVSFSRGVILNRRLSEYRVPRFSDLPELKVELLNRPDLPPAGGGETPMISIAPAIGNAIFDAVQVRLRALPLAPDGRVPAPDRRSAARAPPAAR